MHPIAVEAIQKSAEFGCFLPKRMVTILADIDPARCVRWAYELVAPEVKRVNSTGVVSQTLCAVGSAIDDPVVSYLPTLDRLAWESWTCDFEYSVTPFYFHRASSRLAWATMGLIVVTHDTNYECQFLCGPIAGRDAGFGMVISECAASLSMTFSDSDDGCLMVAQSFSLLMDSLS